MRILPVLLIFSLLAGCISSTQIEYDYSINAISENQRSEIVNKPEGAIINSHVIFGPFINTQNALFRNKESYKYTCYTEGLGGFLVSRFKTEEYDLDGKIVRRSISGDLLAGLLITAHTDQHGEEKNQACDILLRCFGGTIINGKVYGKFFWITIPL